MAKVCGAPLKFQGGYPESIHHGTINPPLLSKTIAWENELDFSQCSQNPAQSEKYPIADT